MGLTIWGLAGKFHLERKPGPSQSKGKLNQMPSTDLCVGVGGRCCSGLSEFFQHLPVSLSAEPGEYKGVCHCYSFGVLVTLLGS